MLDIERDIFDRADRIKSEFKAGAVMTRLFWN
jgi:hypothetical protein